MLFFIFVVFIGNVLADILWDGGGANTLWSTAENWVGDEAPGIDYAAQIDVTGAICLIDSSVTAECKALRVGNDNIGGPSYLTMTGGSLTTSSLGGLLLGQNAEDSEGVFDLSGGTIYARHMHVGGHGTGRLNMSGGTLTITTTAIYIPRFPGGIGHIQLDGGTIETPEMIMIDGGTIDIIGGTLIIDGDVSSLLSGWIADGWLTAYNGSGSVIIDNSGTPEKTIVTGEPPIYKAHNPFPTDGGASTVNAQLSWAAGLDAISHNVYFGENSPPVFVGNQTDTTFDPGTLVKDHIYYWRIDEVTPKGIIEGDEWSFTASSEYYVVDIREHALADAVETFQGVINRTGSRLFVIQYSWDIPWLDVLEQDYDMTYTSVTVEQALNQADFRADCNQVIVYDVTDCELAVNNAVTLAGIHGACVCEDGDLDTLLNYGFTIHTDIRGVWTDNETAQLYAYNHYRSDCNDSWMGLQPGDWYSHRGWDFMVQNNMLCWCIDQQGTYLSDGATTQQGIMASYPPVAVAYGWWVTEGWDVEALSSNGHTMVGWGSNNSFTSKLPKPTLQQKRKNDIIEYDPDKTYVMLSFTQGDAMSFNQEENYNHVTDSSVVDPNVRVSEKCSYGLQHSTLSHDIQPMVAAACYNEMTAEQGFAGKGYGYTRPTKLYENDHLDTWLDVVSENMAKMDILDIKVNDPDIETDETPLDRICEYLQPRSVILKHQIYPSSDEDDPPAMYHGVPVFGDPVDGVYDASDNPAISNTVSAIVESATKRNWFWVYLRHRWTAADMEAVWEEIEANHPDIVMLGLDEFVRLYLRIQPCETAQSEPGFEFLNGDINQDCDVDIYDLMSIVSNWLASGPGLDGDLDGDNDVNLEDFALFAGNWLETNY